MEHLTCRSFIVINGNKLTCVVPTVIKCSSLDDSIKKKATPKNSIMTWIYGAPKIHIDGVPLIPTINMIGYLT